jgi:PAS domain S-box-containing protein
MNSPFPLARHRWNIRAKLLALVLAVAIPSFGLVTYALFGAAQEAQDAAFARVQYLATSAASSLDFVIRDSAAELDQLARRPRVRVLDARVCDPLIEALVSLNRHYVSLGLRDREGRVLCSSRPDPLPAEVVTSFPWFKEGWGNGKPMVGDAFLHPKTARWVSVLTHPLGDDSGQVVALLSLSLDLRSLQDRLFDTLPEGALVTVIDRNNAFLMRSTDPDRWIGKPLPGPQAGRAGGRRIGEPFETMGVDGVTRMYAVAVVPSAGWHVFAALPRDVVFAAQRERLVRSASIGLAVLIAVSLLTYAIGSAISRPIGELARAAEALSGGEGRAQASTQGAGEIETVAGELQRLAGERERSREERSALVAHYEHLLKSARDIYLLIDAQGRIADFNDAAVAAYDYTPDKLRGKLLIDLRAPEARDSYQRDWREVEKLGGGLFDSIHQRSDGSCFPVEASSRTVVIDGAVYHHAFVRDITARKASEEVLRRQNTELDRFNRAAVGRELDMIELKRRINALARELGRQPPYPLEFLDSQGDAIGKPPQP